MYASIAMKIILTKVHFRTHRTNCTRNQLMRIRMRMRMRVHVCVRTLRTYVRRIRSISYEYEHVRVHRSRNSFFFTLKVVMIELQWPIQFEASNCNEKI